MVNGNILLDEDGLNIHKINDNEKRSAVGNFCEMIEEANIEGDTLHYIYESSCNIYSILYDQGNPHCKLIGQRLFCQLQNLFGNFPHAINSLEEFETKSEPRTHGGFRYENSPSSDYVYDKSTIDKWHDQWFKDNPDKIDWSKSNDIFPRYDKTLEVLRKELQKLKGNPDFISGLEHLEKQYIASVDIDKLSAQEVVSKFYSLIMDHKAENGERISYAKEIGSKICELNYYHHEQELEDLNKCNQQIVKIYSIKMDDKYQFLSIDKKHGRFELCDDNGDHLCELMFDGTKVENSQKANHSILHISDWKRTYHK